MRFKHSTQRYCRWETYQVELLLQFLIGIVDAKLLEAIHVKCFKSVRSQRQRKIRKGSVSYASRAQYTIRMCTEYKKDIKYAKPLQTIKKELHLAHRYPALQ